MTSIYRKIKEQITARDVAQHYGHQVSRSGMMRCPFHNDRNPSMKVDRNFICFGCQEKGDVIRFAERLFNLQPFEAAKKLIEDFGLSIDVKCPDKREGDNENDRCTGTAGEKQDHKDSTTIQEIQSEFDQWIRHAREVLLVYFHTLHSWKEQYAPREPSEEWHPLFCEALLRESLIGYWLDILDAGSKEDQIRFYKSERGEVENLEKRLGQSRCRNDRGSERPDIN